MKREILAFLGLALGLLSGAFVGGVQAVVIAVGVLCFYGGLSLGHPQQHARNQHHAHNK